MSSFNYKKIGLGDLVYYRERNRNKVYAVVVSLFSKLVETSNLTKRELAFRLNKEPAQITRWLSGPSNWTLDTVSDLLLAMGAELDHRVSLTANKNASTHVHPLWRDQSAKVIFIKPDQPPKSETDKQPQPEANASTNAEPLTAYYLRAS
jgi:hypothetical protein